MASSSTEVPYNHPTENALFGQNVIEKITDTCLGQDGKRYYQVKWRDSWEPEERLMAACEGALQTFWKEYYSNVEKEIRKQVIAYTSPVSSITTSDSLHGAGFSTTQATKVIINTSVKKCKNDSSIDINASDDLTAEAPSLIMSENADDSTHQNTVRTLSGANITINSLQHTNQKIIETFPEQSSTVAYYAVQDNENSENEQEESLEEVEMSDQAELLTQIINSQPGIAKWSSEDVKPNVTSRRTLTTITADTLNTKNVSGPDANSKFHCDICNKMFVSKRNVQRHMLSHTGEKPWMCEFCFKRFRQKPHLEQHVNIHKGIKNAVCSICGKAFNHRSNLVTHMATHSSVRPHSCIVCGENFKLKHTLAKHMMVHTKQDIEKRHQCQICKRSFRDKSYLAEHETIHNKEKPWQCDICKKSFSFKRRYQMHLEVHQSKDGGEEFVCHLCPKKFKGKIYLQKHLERHEYKRKRRKKIKLEKEGFIGDPAVELNVSDGLDGDDLEVAGEDDDIDLSMSEVDVKAEDDLEEGEKIDHTDDDSSPDDGSHVLHINAEEQPNSDPSMVVAGMLPISGMNMEDATYVALAQLTQAAIESSPIGESGGVILMSYEEIQKSMQELHAHHHGGVNDDDLQYNIQVTQVSDENVKRLQEALKDNSLTALGNDCSSIRVIQQPIQQSVGSIHVLDNNGDLHVIETSELH
ncbi:zinc finger protein ZFAT isoform X1 [Hydra vulgaris]|uniref:Zinc finger protein ZFAT isoform X1 n=1 Tax=Hydra vulgaris TaxID=6087 RepID=A0ABM4CXK3_HYDVU